MKKMILLFCIPCILSAANISGPAGSFGLGIMLGEPTGISLKYWSSKTNAWDGGIAWGFGAGGALYLHSDYLWHNFNFIPVDEGKLPLYYGLGGRVLFADKSHLGVRGVVGLDYMFARAPVDIFLEIAPIFDLIPGTDFTVNGAIGIRYFF
jgi:hypothetical protein